MLLRILAGLTLLATVACSPVKDLEEKPLPLGDFSFGHNIVVAPNAVQGPVSRVATEEEWQEALKTAIGTRFDRYEGDKLYHFGVSVQGYVLALPGVPIVASPKSVLILNLDVWDDAAGTKMNEKSKQITVLENFSGESFLGSGLTQSKERQMELLSQQAAKQILTYLTRQHKEEGWFGPEIAPEVASESEAEPTPEESAAQEAEQAAEEDTEAEAAEPVENTGDSADTAENSAESDENPVEESAEDATDA